MRRYYQPRIPRSSSPRSSRQPGLSRNHSLSNYVIPAIGLAGVTTLASVLIVLVVLRAVPGMGRIFSPDTHSNLWEETKPDYTRTQPIFLEETGQAAGPLNWAPNIGVEEISEIELGHHLFIGAGCARCHGLTGEGAAVGPPVAGASPQIVQAMARFGTGGMPAFSLDVLPERDLAAIAAYLQSLEPPVEATPTPEPSQDESNLPLEVLGQQLFERLEGGPGCAYCHGFQAQGDFGPRLVGLSETTIRSIVRSGMEDMPTFSQAALSDEELTAIIAYIQSLATPAEATPTPELPQGPAPEVLGGQLFSSKRCDACHGPQAGGSAFAPRLVGISETLAQTVVRSGRNAMPAFSQATLSDEELATIIVYLQSLDTSKP